MHLYHFAELMYPFRGVIEAVCGFLIKARKANVVLVFGMSRSGTTFLGKSLSLNTDNSVYIHEPVKNMMHSKYASIHGNKSKYWNFVFQEKQVARKVHYLVCVVLAALLKGRVKKGGVLCIKPITMVDSIHEASKAIDASIVYISRHPCGWAESTMRQRLEHPERYDEKKPDKNKLCEWGERWGRQNKKIKELFQNNPGWRWVVFEDLCIEPVIELRKLYKALNIEWTEHVEEQLRAMTSTPSEKFYGTNRRSRDQIDKWHDVLSSDEIEAIRAGCAKYETGIYENF